MDFFDTVAQRYSHKEEFAPTPVPINLLKKIAKAGLDAPNGRNSQAVRLIILPDEASMATIRTITPALNTAPAAIAVFTDCAITPSGSKVLDIEDYSAAVTQMLLAATALGYSALWLDSPFWSDEAQKNACQILAVPQKYHLWAVIPIGLPKGDTKRREKLPFEDRVSYGKFGMREFS